MRNILAIDYQQVIIDSKCIYLGILFFNVVIMHMAFLNFYLLCLIDIDRPSLGCRVLVQKNLSKILPAALRDMADWTTDTRIKVTERLVFNTDCGWQTADCHLVVKGRLQTF